MALTLDDWAGRPLAQLAVGTGDADIRRRVDELLEEYGDFEVGSDGLDSIIPLLQAPLKEAIEEAAVDLVDLLRVKVGLVVPPPDYNDTLEEWLRKVEAQRFLSRKDETP